MAPFIQVAGIRSLDEALMLAELGVPYLGFPLGLDVHAEDVPRDEAARIIRSMPERVRPVLITYLHDPPDVLDLLDTIGAAVVQLHGPVTRAELAGLRQERPGLGIIKSLVIRPDNAGEIAAQVDDLGELVDAFITDTYDPSTGASGATGLTHDWSVSRALVERSPRPVILAGGLTPLNVAEAVRVVRPAGVDAHTGVEGPDGWKDPTLVRDFVKHAALALGDGGQFSFDKPRVRGQSVRASPHGE